MCYEFSLMDLVSLLKRPSGAVWERFLWTRLPALSLLLLQSAGCSLIYSFHDTRREICDDGEDNDTNGLSDCSDPACFGPSCAEVGALCDDKLDNDGDELADCLDRGCFGMCPEDDFESCTDERDNDGDGLLDGADPRCWAFRQVRQTSCLSTDPVHVSVSLWDLPTQRTARSSDGQLEYRSEILDGNWQELDLQVWLRSPLVHADGEVRPDFVDAAFQNIEISLVPATLGEDIPRRLEEHGLFTIRLKPSEAIVTLPNEEVTVGWPDHIRLFDGQLQISERMGENVSREVGLALPESQPARLVVRSIDGALAIPKHRLIQGDGCHWSLDWSLELDAPGRLPCGAFSPDREAGGSAFSCVEDTLPASISIATTGQVAAAGLAPPTEEGLPSSNDVCSFDPDTAEFPGDPPKGIDTFSVSWTPHGWKMVAWNAGRQLLLATSRDCRSWSSPQVIFTDRNSDRELGLPSWIPEGTFAHPPQDAALGLRQHPEQVLFSAKENGLFELLSLRRTDSGEWSPAPEKVYSFTHSDQDDLVAEPIRAVILGDHELALMVRIRQNLQNSVGILLATSMDEAWNFVRADPWPFRSPSGNPALLDAVSLSGAVASYRDGKGWLFIEGDPESQYPIIGGDQSGLVLLHADLSEMSDAEDDPGPVAMTTPIGSTFPAERLVGFCNQDGVCDLFESCGECPAECTCGADLLMQGCWDAPVLKDEVELSADLAGDFVLRGRIAVPQEAINRSCHPRVQLNFAGDDPFVHGLSFSGQPVAFDDAPPRDEAIPTLHTEWAFEMARAGDSLTRRVYSPTGCLVVDSTLDLDGAVAPALYLGSRVPCSNVVLDQLELLDATGL